MTYKALEDYFNNLNNEPLVDGYPAWSGLPAFKEKENEDMFNDDEEPMTSIYFQIRTPAVQHLPSHEHTVRLDWQEGARWHDILWEVCKALEAHYGYDIKNRVFYQVHELAIEAEDSHGDPDLAKQMFSKEVS